MQVARFAAATVALSGCMVYGTDLTGEDESHVRPTPTRSADANQPKPAKDAGDAGPSRARYGGYLAATKPVAYGDAPARTTCNWQVTLRNVVVELDRFNDEVTDVRVRDTAVEEVVSGCTNPPHDPGPQQFTMMSHTRMGDVVVVGLTGAQTNSPEAALKVTLREIESGYEATLEWERTDLPNPWKWEVSTSMKIGAQMPDKRCIPGLLYCGGINVRGAPGIIYKCDETGDTLSFERRCPLRCTEGSTTDMCE